MRDINQVFSEGNVLAKTVRTLIDEDRNWLYLLDQLVDPKTNRPVKPLNKNLDRTHRYNFLTKKWEEAPRSCEKLRGAPKETPFTKKMSTTLMPQDGQIHLYTHGDYLSLGVLFDATQCHLKQEKYIFNQEVNTNSRFWLKNHRKQLDEMPKSTSLQALKDYLSAERAKGIIPQYNELLVGLSQSALIGVFFRNNNLHERLLAYRYRALIKEKLNIIVPVIFISPDNAYRVISESEIDENIKAGLRSQTNQINHILSLRYLKQFDPTVFTSHHNAAFYDVLPLITKHLTQQEHGLLCQAMGQKKSYFEDVAYYAGVTFSDRVIEDNERFLQFLKSLIAKKRYQPLLKPLRGDFRSTLEVYVFYQEELFKFLRELLNNLDEATLPLFRELAYHINNFNATDLLSLTRNYIFENKTINTRAFHLIQISGLNVKEDSNTMLHMALFAKPDQLKPFISNNEHLHNFSLEIPIQTQAERNSHEYTKNTVNTIHLPYLGVLLLYQNEKIANQVIKNTSSVDLKNTLEALRMLKVFAKKYQEQKFEWSSHYLCGHKIQENEVICAQEKFLKIICAQKRNDLILNFEEKRMLEGLIVNVINGCETKAELDSLEPGVLSHPLVNQHRHSLFDTIFRKEKTRIRECVEGAIRDRKASVMP